MFEKSFILIIIIFWLITLVLGINYLFKNKLWKTTNCFLLFLIGGGYIIILFQIIFISNIFSSKTMINENYANVNKHFKLMDRKTIPLFKETNYSWDLPLHYGARLTTNNYNGDGDKHCKPKNITVLTELLVVSKQQLQDAQTAYQNLINLKNNLIDGNIKDFDALHKIIKNANDKMKVVNTNDEDNS